MQLGGRWRLEMLMTGVVELSGEADSLDSAARAARLASQVAGVLADPAAMTMVHARRACRIQH